MLAKQPSIQLQATHQIGDRSGHRARTVRGTRGISRRILEPVAQLLASAAGRTQLLVTTHSDGLAGLVQKVSGAKRIRLEKIDGETRVTTEPEAEGADQGA